MDIDLKKGLTGLDVALQLQGKCDAPIVFFTSSVDPDLELLTGTDRVFGYLTKPVHGIAFRATIELVRLQHASRARLQELEHRYHALFDQAAVGVAQVDGTGRFIEVNRRCAEIFARPVEEMRDVDAFAIAVPAQRAAYLDGLGRIGRGELNELSIDLCCRRRDGTLVWVEVAASPLGGAIASSPHAVVIVQDVTARRRAEDALRRHEHLLAESQRIAAVGSFAFDFATGANTWTDEMYRLHGRTAATFTPTGASIAEVVHPDDLGKVVASMTYVQQPAWVHSALKFRTHPRDGECRVLEAHGELVRDDRGVAYAAIGTVQDITPQVRAEAALRESEARYRSVFDHAVDGIVRTTLAGVIVDANPALVAIAGTATTLLGTPLQARFLHAEDVDALDLAHHQPGRPIEATWRRPDGGPIRVQIDGVVLGDGPGRHFLGFVRDLTAERERTARESRLLEHNEQLELVIDGTRLGVWNWYPRPDTVLVSPRMREMLGDGPDDQPPTLAAWTSRIHPDDLDSFHRAFEAHVHGGQSYFQHVHRVRRADGRWIHVLDRGTSSSATPRIGRSASAAPTPTSPPRRRPSARPSRPATPRPRSSPT